ncbi:D-inositol-3-phosphate glycosyltransferase (plasmid) [Tsukamurella tyrosinosolvens]|uniref:Glycosyltransferase involved in cell wall bisynthesis n=1 Tax=Tsukamurella tyrosinosolvens TaxID=57704 RepID=A0A1H4TZX2_TSUTY|nr:Glycosyltransferase involved in cell wall bisynthesis [Tsukamurella tyrosinosolvens]VEH93909.1 D-inositol-3-phosphate glycosyltransferase [Tsukamurella tyrosinosolvens]
MSAVPVHLTGTTWPGTAPGGLPRYFADLFAALRLCADLDVGATAFGDPEPGGASWGPDAGSTAARVRASRRPAPAGTAVLDRHFALFGPAPRGAALVTHFHGPWAQESAAAGEGRVAVAVKAFVERARYRGSDRFVVLSQAFADVLVARYGADRGAIAVIPPGVDLARFTATPVPDGPPRVLCVRRLERRMGIDVLLRAWPAVLARHPGARLDVVGDGSQRRALQQHASDLGITDTVTFVGTIDDADLARRYAAATLTAVPSVAWEGFGLVALESLASGRAPVVTDVGGLPDAVRDLAADLVVSAGDPDALADRLAAGLDGVRPSAQDCRAHAERFSWGVAAARHAALYRAVAA